MTFRFAAIAAAAVIVILAAIGVVAAPGVANWYATKEVDRALAQVRKRGTAVAHRGAVTFDIWSRTLTVRDVSVDAPGPDGAKMSVAMITAVRPSRQGDRIAAENLRFTDAKMIVGHETATAPSVEIVGYVGPDEPVTPAGAIPLVRTRADLLADMSMKRASAPTIEVRNDVVMVTRRATDVVIERVERGLASRVTVQKLDVAVDPITAAASSATDGATDERTAPGFRLRASAGPLLLENLSAPTLMRFQDGTVADKRQPAVARVVLSGFMAETSGKRGLPLKMSARRLEGEDVSLRAFGQSTAALEDIEAKRRRGEDMTPAEIRQRLLFIVDAAHAVSFGRLIATEAAYDGPGRAGEHVVSSTALFELVGYADGRLARVALNDADVAAGPVRASIGGAAVTGFDASGLLAYGDKVGNDRVLLTRTPPPDEMLSLFPRVDHVEFNAVDAMLKFGQVSIGSLRTGARGTADDLPNRIGLSVQNFSAPLPKGWAFADALSDAGIDRLNLSFRTRLSLDPLAKTLTLDGLDYSTPGIADVTLKGSLSGVDPSLAVVAGADFIDKLSAVKVQPFTLRIADHGGVATAIAYAAGRTGQLPEAYRTALIEQVKTEMLDALGPSARSSAIAMGLFLRDGGTIEATITPRSTDTTLLSLLGLLGLGPRGVAQGLDLAVIARPG